MDTNGKSFADHWGWAAGKGLMNANTANGISSAVRKVLAIEKGWETMDISKLDVDGLIKRFENLEKKNFTPRSLNTYGSRFRQALTSYMSYLKDPGGWKPTGSDRPTKANGSDSKKKTASKAENVGTSAVVPEQPVEKGAAEYPFPLRSGFTARLILPRDLKAGEVKRLATFMSALVADETVETTA